MRCISCELWSYQSPIWNCSTSFCEIFPAISVHILQGPTYVCRRLECVDWFDEHVLGRRRITWMNYEAWMIGLPILTSVSANQKKRALSLIYDLSNMSNTCIILIPTIVSYPVNGFTQPFEGILGLVYVFFVLHVKNVGLVKDAPMCVSSEG